MENDNINKETRAKKLADIWTNNSDIMGDFIGSIIIGVVACFIGGFIACIMAISITYTMGGIGGVFVGCFIGGFIACITLCGTIIGLNKYYTSRR